MNIRQPLHSGLCALALLWAGSALAAARPAGFPGGHQEALGPLYKSAVLNESSSPVQPAKQRSTILLKRWNSIAVDASGLDHSPVGPGEVRVFGEQLGPARASRAMAIVHIAMFDAVNAITPRYRSYSDLYNALPETSMDAAIAQAAHDTLVALFPSQKIAFDQRLTEDLAQVEDRVARLLGQQLGRIAASAILSKRSADGSAHSEMRMNVDYLPNTLPGYWRQDPISQVPIALGARWSEVRPFVIESASQFRIPPPPAMDSNEYVFAFNEAKALGGDGVHTPTMRTADQTAAGIFWAYDGTPSLCAPPRLYNQVTEVIAGQMNTETVDLARLLALVNTAMADAGIASWESKYHYKFWRPITGIREADYGTGPTAIGDSNPATLGDTGFTPLGAPASNLNGPNFTPPFPAYPSGHATFGGALFQTLRRFYGRDDIRFTFVSDEFNGRTIGNDGRVRPLLPRTFESFSQAEEENGQSRIYLGIHWSFDKTEGIKQGRQIADYVFEHAFQPLPVSSH